MGRPRGAGNGHRFLTLLLALLTLALAARVASVMGRVAVESRRTQHWDPTAHGVHGVKMAEALRHGDVVEFARLVHERAVWPPLYPMLEAPVFLVLGNSVDVAEAMMAFVLLVAVVLAFATGLAFGTPRAMFAGALVAAAMAASPMFLLFGTQIMLELPGVVLLFLVLIFYARYRRDRRTADARMTAIALMLTFFLKYNYAILTALPMAINEFAHMVPTPAQRFEALRAAGWRAALDRFGYLILLGVVSAFWAALAFLRYGHHGAAGLLRPATAVLVLVAVAGLVVRPRTRAASIRAWWRSCDPLIHSVIAWVVIPTALWLVFPSHLKGLVQFGINRSSNLPLLSAQNLLFYPRSFALDYGPTPVIGWILLALGFSAFAFMGALTRAERVVPIMFAVDLVLATIHRFKADRFPFPAVPLLWLSAGLTIGLLIERLSKRAGATATWRAVTAVAGLLLLTSLCFSASPRRGRELFDASTTPESVLEVVDATTDVEVASRGTLLFGFWNQLPIGLFEWEMLLRHPGPGHEGRPRNPQWYATTNVAALLDSAADDRTIERVIALELSPTSPLYRGKFEIENPWAGPLVPALDRDPRFVAETLRVFTPSGYVMHVYRKRAG